MSTDRAEPTAAMLEFFERRTRAHIARVARCLKLVAKDSPHAAELIERAGVHDASKFGPEERVPYVWLTEYHRCRRLGVPFEYPAGVAEQVRSAIRHHVTSNRHHPEAHADPSAMSDVDLIEMVCDWTAMSQESGQDGGSARGWAERALREKFAFDPERQRFILQTIEALDRLLAAEGG